MRRWIVRGFAATAVVGVALLAGCTKLPTGADGNLTNQWPALAEVKGWEPKVGTCHTEFSETSLRSKYLPVDCTKTHSYETAYIGKSAATTTAAPKPGDADHNTAWAECDKQVSTFLGGEWRDAKVWFGVSWPSNDSWTGGARWFRCEIGKVENIVADDIVTVTNSLKGKAGEMRYGCFQVAEKAGQPYGVRECNKAHNSEYAGTFVAKEHYNTISKSEWAPLHTKCRSVIAKFVGVADKNMQYRTGTYLMFPTAEDWANGDHSVRCYLYMGSKKLTRSLKGAGNSALPNG